MFPQIERLYQIAQKSERLVLGLMSGTSLDGLDIACCLISGSGSHTRVKLLHFTTIPYDTGFKSDIRQIFAQRTIDFQHLVLLNAEIARNHAESVLSALITWQIEPQEIDLLASHGQTVFHAPQRLHGITGRPNATLQIGDGDHLARKTGIITLSDFRQQHIAAGGEGAPLALYGDAILFSDELENRILLNIGGIANFTWLPATNTSREVMATDTGPGNTLIDLVCRQYFNLPMDQDGAMAQKGKMIPSLLAAFKNDGFFLQDFPKTTGPEQFNRIWMENIMGTLTGSPTDLLATLTHLTADTIAEAILKITPHRGSNAVYVSGGGAHNHYLMALLSAKLEQWPIFHVSELGIPVDAKEAVLFAILANETVAGTEKNEFWPANLPKISMGKISLPV